MVPEKEMWSSKKRMKKESSQDLKDTFYLFFILVLAPSPAGCLQKSSGLMGDIMGDLEAKYRSGESHKRGRGMASKMF